MNTRISLPGTIVGLVLGLAACSPQEESLTTAYFQGLGPNNAALYLKQCVAQKKPLLERKDAAGLNQFAKSVRAGNCLTAYQYAAEEGGKALMAKSAVFGQATTVSEAKGIWEQMKKDVSAQWDEPHVTFPEWKEAETPLSKALMSAEAAYIRATSRINIEALKNYGK